MDCEREIEPQISQPRPQHHDSNYHSIHYSIYNVAGFLSIDI